MEEVMAESDVIIDMGQRYLNETQENETGLESILSKWQNCKSSDFSRYFVTPALVNRQFGTFERCDQQK
jgi:hypothetical protein